MNGRFLEASYTKILIHFSFSIVDSNIEIIYVCPYKTSEDTKQYYLKLIGMVNSNSKGSSIAERCTFVVPDALGRFPVRLLLYTSTLLFVV